MINIIKNIFAVIGLACTATSVIVSSRLIWEGRKERNEEANNYYQFSDDWNNWDNYHD